MYRVSADIRYTTGALAGVDIHDGHCVTAPTPDDALRHADWITGHRITGAAVSAVGTGNLYAVTSPARIHRIAQVTP